MTNPTEPLAVPMNFRDEILKYANNPKNQPVSMQEIAQYAQSLHGRDVGGMCVLLADIREAAGDPEGRLMQDELVRRIAVFRDALSEIASTAGSLQSMDINLRLAVERARDALEFLAVRGAP